MKKLTAAVTLVVCIAGAAYAAGPDHSVPGVPGTPGCKGQTTAYLAQASKNGQLEAGFRGIGGVIRFGEGTITPADVRAAVENFCAGV